MQHRTGDIKELLGSAHVQRMIMNQKSLSDFVVAPMGRRPIDVGGLVGAEDRF
jgi:hypothetical protein